MNSTSTFYDDMASLYHLVHENWEQSIERQAGQIARIAKERWGMSPGHSILDVSCGIGTQAIGLANLGFRVVASDISQNALRRARTEARRRSLDISFSVCDMRNAYQHNARCFDLVIACDNAITHLLTDDDICDALRQMYACVRPGGGCLLTVRDYAKEPRGVGLLKPCGVREKAGQRIIVFQVWDFDGEIYDLAMYFVADRGDGEPPKTRVMRARYYAISTDRLLQLMEDAGFVAVARLEERFFQPVLIGTRKT